MAKVIDIEKYKKHDIIEIDDMDLYSLFGAYFEGMSIRIEMLGSVEEIFKKDQPYIAEIKPDRELVNFEKIWNHSFAGRQFKDIKSILATYLDVLCEQKELDRLSDKFGKEIKISQRNDKIEKALMMLVALKNYKDEKGKDEYYIEAKQLAWARATKALKGEQ